jgi:Integrase core domain
MCEVTLSMPSILDDSEKPCRFSDDADRQDRQGAIAPKRHGGRWHPGISPRECLDRMLIFGEAHLRQTLSSYAAYYNEVRPHLALGKDAPLGRAVQRRGRCSHPNLVWPAPPLRSDMIFGKHRCALIGVFGRGLRCKPRTWSFDINSTCCGARYKTKARYKDLIRNGARRPKALVNDFVNIYSE